MTKAESGAWATGIAETIAEILLTACTGFMACKAESAPAGVIVYTGV